MELGFFTMPIHPPGKDWADPGLVRQSLALLAEQVKPAVNAASASGGKAAE